MSANDTQVGGTHYQSKIQLWDIFAKHQVGFLEANAAKYVYRWRDKDGIQDLQKAQHYIAKAIELVEEGVHHNHWDMPDNTLMDFFDANPQVQLMEQMVISFILGWAEVEALKIAHATIHVLIEESKKEDTSNGEN